MTIYAVKDKRGGRKVRALVSTKAVYGCPNVDPASASFFADMEHHARARSAGDHFTETVSVDSEVIEQDETGTYRRKVVIYREGKVSDRCLPVCKCGEEFVKVGYHFKLTDEDHSAQAVRGMMRFADGDRVIEDKWFKTRKAALRHLDAVYARYSR